MFSSISVFLPSCEFTRSGHTQLPGNAIMITSTITVVLFSTVVFGLMTKPLIRLLQPPCHKLLSSASSEPTTPLSLFSSLLENGQGVEEQQSLHRPSSLRMLLTKPTHTVHYYWRKFDDSFMRPAFGGRGFVPFVPGSPTERSIHAED